MQPITELIPIRLDQYGRYRVGDTNVLLDLVIIAYRRGDTPESIIGSYPTLSLDDVYFTIGYYIRHQSELDAYLQKQQQIADINEQEDKANIQNQITREMLLERLKNRRSTG